MSPISMVEVMEMVEPIVSHENGATLGGKHKG
jgi:hypothetical protein